MKEEREKGVSEDFLVYQPPEVEVTVVRVEFGFALSTPPNGNAPDWNPSEGEWE